MITKTKAYPEALENRACSNWGELSDWIDAFPLPETWITADGEISAKTWVFRGVTDSTYPLEPSIERYAQAKTMEWAALETLVTSEFKARASTHLTPALIPNDELTWLAIMQHYAIPTRLLDFTYSPYVALYFGIRNNRGNEAGKHLRLYAINASALNDRFTRIAYEAARQERASEDGSTSQRFRVASLDPDSFSTDRDSVTAETAGLRDLVSESLAAEGKRRGVLNRKGSVCATAPPSFNPRLASQQGLFLLNCAEQLTFRDSLAEMMHDRKGWQCLADIPLEMVPEIEAKLFQMNIHDQSLFPDLEGLAGLIRQKIHLQWK
jgi:FRG domain